MLPEIGSTVGGKYRVIRLIGEGGMGSVYEAYHAQLGTRVALKFLHPDLAEQQALVGRFLQEARVSARIKSPHVTHVMDVDQTPDGAAYFVMELLEGESLEQRMEREKPLPLTDTLDIAIQILAALEAAHGEGVVHRDLKPDNVWLTPAPGGPHVKLLDFGIAKLRSANEFQSVHTRPGSMMGTPAYMAPEQAISADQVDLRADLYSFGVMVYEMLSGKRPVEGEDVSEIIQHIVNGEAQPLRVLCPDVPEELAALVDSLVSADPDARPASASLVRSVIARYVHSSNPPPASRLSAPAPPLQDTVPPVEPDLPPYVTRSQAVARAPTGTDAMGAIPQHSFGSAATISAFPPPHPGSPPRKRGLVAWLVFGLLFLGVAAGAGAGVWLYASSLDDDPLPPMPTSAVIPTSKKIVDMNPVVPPARSDKRRSSTSAGPEMGGSGPSEGTPLPVPTFPQFPILFPVPSGIIPSALPPLFPGMPQPTSKGEAPAASPTPASSAPTQ